MRLGKDIVSGVFWEGHFGHARSGIIVLGRLSFGLDILHHCFFHKWTLFFVRVSEPWYNAS